MSKYHITQAKKLQDQILELQHDIKLNANAIQANKAAKSGKHIIEELEAKDKRLKKKLEKTTKKFYSYADENLKISDLNKLDGYPEEEEDPYDEDYY